MMMSESAVELKEFQHNRDTAISPIGTVGEKALLGLMDRPMFDQRLLVPTSFHRVVTLVMSKVTIVPILEHDERVSGYQRIINWRLMTASLLLGQNRESTLP